MSKNEDKKFKIAFSRYFGQNIMCVRYVSDNDWSFVLVDGRRQPCSRILKAQSKYSCFNWQ